MDRSFEFFTYETSGSAARLTLNRPDRLNAIHQPAAVEMERIAYNIAQDANVRVVAVRGVGRAFCTGIDLKELATARIDINYHPTWERALRTFETMDKIVLCLIHGFALGGGLQLALACDIRVSTPTAEMGLPAVHEGLIPGLGTLRLARYVGMGRAKKMIFLGQRIDGREAHRIGLVDHLVSEEGAFEQFEGILEQYGAAASEGCRLSKLALIECFDLGFEKFLEHYLALQGRAMSSEDFREALAAYHDKRSPVWK